MTISQIGKRLIETLGYRVTRIHPPAGISRPIGRTSSLLEDLKARGDAPSLVFDCGASDGAWTRLALDILPDARIVMIEPRETMRPALEALAASSPGISTVAAAVGAKAGTATLTDWDTASTLSPVADTKGASQSTVAVTTLNAVAEEFGVPDLVKLDVEGFELEALQGASALFGRTELFLVETALFPILDMRPLLHDAVAFMAERGYLVYDFGDFIRRPFDGALGLIDVCFARAQGTVRSPENQWFRSS